MPRIELTDRWRVLKSAGFGFRQPVALGELVLPPDHGVDLPRLDEFFQTRLGAAPALPAGEPTSLAAQLLSWAHRLEWAHRVPVFGPGRVLARTAEAERHIYHFVVPYFDPAATRACLRWVLDAASNLAAAETRLAALARQLEAIAPKSINTLGILQAAIHRDVPLQHVAGEGYILGHGRKSRWLLSSMTDQTPALSVKFARAKNVASRVLALHGLPVAENRQVGSVEEAIACARQFGFPVVVKPADQDGGVGVHAGLTSEQQVRECYEDARKHSNTILLERHVHGRDFRITVLHGTSIKAMERIPGGVTGDGRSDIRQLLHAAASDPVAVHRKNLFGKTLLSLDDEASGLLREAGMTADSVPAAGAFVPLRRRANVSSGGTTRPVMDSIHPDNLRLAERAAAVMRLDVAGIDLLLPDASRSWLDTGGAICEVNAQPQMGETFSPGLFDNFVAELLGGDGRIPICLVLTDHANADPAIVRRYAEAFASGQPGAVAAGRTVAMLDGRRLPTAAASFTQAANAALHSPEAERAILLADPVDLLANGLPGARIDVLVLDFSGDGDIAGKAGMLAALLQPHLAGPCLLMAGDAAAKRLAEALGATDCREIADAPGQRPERLGTLAAQAIATTGTT